MVGAFVAADDILLVAVVVLAVAAVAAPAVVVLAVAAVAAPAAVVVVAVTESCFDHVLYLNEIQLGSDSENL